MWLSRKKKKKKKKAHEQYTLTNLAFKTPKTTLFSGFKMFLKQMNEINSLIFSNFVFGNTHKYHEKYSINALKF